MIDKYRTISPAASVGLIAFERRFWL